MKTEPSRLGDAPHLTAPGVLRRVFGGPKLFLLAMAAWTIGVAVLAVNVGNHFGDIWGGVVGIIIGPLVLARMMRWSFSRR